MATRLELEAMIDSPKANPDEIVEAMLGSLHFKYAKDLLENDQFFNTANCNEARTRIISYLRAIKQYKIDNIANPKAKTMTYTLLKEAADTKDYEKLAIYRIDSNFFDKLPGLETHKVWKEGIIASLNRPFGSGKPLRISKHMERVLLDAGYTKQMVIDSVKEYYKENIAKAAISSSS